MDVKAKFPWVLTHSNVEPSICRVTDSGDFGHVDYISQPTLSFQGTTAGDSTVAEIHRDIRIPVKFIILVVGLFEDLGVMRTNNTAHVPAAGVANFKIHPVADFP